MGVELIQDLSQVSSPTQGFLRRHRHRVKTILSNGRRTDTYVVDYVDRPAHRRDAVGVIAFQPKHTPGEAVVLLREQVRYPPLIVGGRPTLIEIVAGLIEGDERPEVAGLRELEEEAGLSISEEHATLLGGLFFPSPGILTERISIVAVELPPDAFDRPLSPLGDGSAMEEGAVLLSMSLDDALSLADRGGSDEEPQIQDAKTELALHRLKRMLEAEP